MAEALKASHNDLLAEYYGLQLETNGRNDYEEANDHHKRLHSGEWDWKTYVQKGERKANFAVHCPKTCEVLEGINGFMTGTPFSFAFFSTLGKGSSIAAHSGPCNLRLRVHYPLIVPSGDCGMEIGTEKVQWEEGVPVIFDDAYVHRVWNNSDEDRVVLLFDLWHPELQFDEIQSIKDMFANTSSSPN